MSYGCWFRSWRRPQGSRSCVNERTPWPHCKILLCLANPLCSPRAWQSHGRHQRCPRLIDTIRQRIRNSCGSCYQRQGTPPQLYGRTTAPTIWNSPDPKCPIYGAGPTSLCDRFWLFSYWSVPCASASLSHRMSPAHNDWWYLSSRPSSRLSKWACSWSLGSLCRKLPLNRHHRSPKASSCL